MVGYRLFLPMEARNFNVCSKHGGQKHASIETLNIASLEELAAKAESCQVQGSLCSQ